MRGRGLDFEHRFRTSRWAEDLLIAALDNKHGLLAVRYGLSEIRQEKELVYGSDSHKEPDLLVYDLHLLTSGDLHVLRNTDLVAAARTDFARGARLHFAWEKAIAAVEVEFSPYKAAEMVGRHWKPRTEEAWRKRPLKNATPPTAPNIFVKEEDLPKLIAWERKSGVPVVVVHLFDQEAFAIRLGEITRFNSKYESASSSDRVKLQVTTGIFKTIQVYERVDAQGARERKPVFRVAPAAAVKAGDLEDITVIAQLGVSASKKYVAHTLFSGGRLKVADDFVKYLRSARKRT